MIGPDVLNITTPPEWMTDGVCAQVDPELWFPEKGDRPGRPRRSAPAAQCTPSAWPTPWPTMSASASGVAHPSGTDAE